MKNKIIVLMMFILLLLNTSLISATESITIDYPVELGHYNNITIFNGNLTAGDDPIDQDNAKYQLNCTNSNGSYYYHSDVKDWGPSSAWNDVSHQELLDPNTNTTWNATGTEIPSEFIDGTCILTMKAQNNIPEDPFYSNNRTFIFDSEPPEITHSSPENDTWTNEEQPSFTFTAIDDFSDTMSCELIIEGEGFGVNSSVLNNTATTITANRSVMEEMEGINNAWIIECTDQAGNIEAPNEWIIHFDQTAPSINLNSPDNNLNTSNSSITFNWTVRDNRWDLDNVSDDNLTTMLSCNLTINNVINATFEGIEDNVINYSSNINYTASFDDGTYYWNTTCIDTTGNTNTSETRYFTIDTTEPTITVSDASTTSSTYTITGTTNGTGSSIVNITFDNSSLSLNSSEVVNFSVQKSLSIGANTYDINVTDAAGNSYNTTVTITKTQTTSGNTYSSGNGTTTSFWLSTYIVNDNDFESGYSKSLAKKKRLKVNVGNETHYVGVVNLTNTTATINVSSEVQQEIFYIGDIHKFEVTGDTFYDIEVKLNEILNNKANITITSIHEEIIIEEVNETTTNNQENQTINITNTTLPKDINNTKNNNISTIPTKEKTSKENLYFFGLIIILIIVYIIINVIIKKRKKKK
jgi:hypothetical protein